MLDYQIEVFIWWFSVVLVATAFYYIGLKITKKYAPKSWQHKYMNNTYLNVGVENNINVAWGIILFLLIIGSTLPIYPTYFSSPTVRITAQGDIIPLPYGTWAWKIPENDTYVRLENTISKCAYMILQGRTEDGLLIEKSGWFVTREMKIVNYTDFYHHYKTNGIDGLCNDIKAIVNAEAWVGKTILPNSQQNIETSNKKILALQQRMETKITDKLPVKILFVSRESQSKNLNE